MFKVIIYDDEVMGCYESQVINFDFKENPIEITTLEDIERKFINGIPEYCIYGSGYIRRMIELDPTTMKKIAKYNKEIELENIQRRIEGRKKELEDLDKEIDDRVRRIKKLEELSDNVYSLDLDKDYCEDDDDEDDDYDNSYDYWD